MTAYHWVSLALLALIFYGVWSVVTSPFRNRGKIASDGLAICPHCGTRGAPKMRAKGSIWIEIVLWLAIVLPGLIYSIWRLTTKEAVCPSCGMPGMISVASPRGKQLVAEFAERPAQRVAEPVMSK